MKQTLTISALAILILVSLMAQIPIPARTCVPAGVASVVFFGKRKH
jgi:hypothetical protein